MLSWCVQGIRTVNDLTWILGPVKVQQRRCDQQRNEALRKKTTMLACSSP